MGRDTVTAVLELRDISAQYGPFRALFGVDLVVQPGEVVALVGPNGVGKTTVARVASGLLRPSSGSVVVCGRAMTGSPTHRFVKSGISHAPEGRSVFATLTVQENLELSFRRILGRGNVPSALAKAYELFPDLDSRRSQVAGTLSGGEQRMLSMARVMVEEPKLLIADELSLGLAPIIVDALYKNLEQLRDAGTALLIVEQQVGHALAIADRVAILNHGEVEWSGTSADAASHVHQALEVS